MSVARKRWLGGVLVTCLLAGCGSNSSTSTSPIATKRAVQHAVAIQWAKEFVAPLRPSLEPAEADRREAELARQHYEILVSQEALK